MDELKKYPESAREPDEISETERRAAQEEYDRLGKEIDDWVRERPPGKVQEIQAKRARRDELAKVLGPVKVAPRLGPPMMMVYAAPGYFDRQKAAPRLGPPMMMVYAAPGYFDRQKVVRGYCRVCGTGYEDGRFCKNCGSVLDPTVERLDSGCCYRCGARIDAGSYCQRCGAALNPTKRCPKCGRFSSDFFCASCGTALTQSSEPPEDVTVQCPTCGERCGANRKFCPSCGTVLKSGQGE